MSLFNKIKLVVLISGNGSNLQALLNVAKQSAAPFTIAAVISDHADAYGLQRAQQANVPHHILNACDFNARELYDNTLSALIDTYQPQLVVLAGFMRILSASFVQHYRGRLLNIHPSLLPKYRGLHTHQRALAAGETEHGASVHFVSEELDGGPVVIQASVPILADDNEARLAQRVQQQEHLIYPLAIQWYAQGRLSLHDNTVYFDGQPLAQALRYAGTVADCAKSCSG